MIVVVGSPIARPKADGFEAAGLSVGVAKAAERGGAAVQLVGRVGEDAAGEAILLDLAASDVGHVAILREPGRPTPVMAVRAPDDATADREPALGEAINVDEDGLEPDETRPSGSTTERAPDGLSVDAGDLELALRYIPDYRVLVVTADLEPSAIRAIVSAAGWAGAAIVGVLGETASSDLLPNEATVFARPSRDAEEGFAAMLAAFAVALDRGDEPGAAFKAAQTAGGWAPITS